jgi:hypothetical protein
MLPRLAELWKARKVIYFVATNHIEYFDRAVTRSERFDAIIFLSPPSFEIKCKRILELLKSKHEKTVEFSDDVSPKVISAAFPKSSCKKVEKILDKDARKEAKAALPPPANALSKFALLRFDELDGLALQLSEVLGDSKTITVDVLKKSLNRLRDGKARSLGEYCRFISDPDGYERFDASKNASWIVTDIEGIDLKSKELPALPTPVKWVGETALVDAAVGERDIEVAGFASHTVHFDGDKPLLGAICLRRIQAE